MQKRFNYFPNFHDHDKTFVTRISYCVLLYGTIYEIVHFPSKQMLTPTEKNIQVILLSVAKMNYVYCGLCSSNVDFIGCDDHVVVIIVLLERMGAAILVSI